MKINVNGKAVEISEKTTLLEFVEVRGIRDGVIAELNGRVVPRNVWADMVLSDGDCLEMVSLVGGG
ncbi:MAG: sulfur carrier protein ThiS [Syntrophobacterales bacterium]|nr:sulfur carrier protein ThiS [Syntrophobacterales bacterium]